MTKCKVVICENAVKALGFCGTHYIRNKRHGDPSCGPTKVDTCKVPNCTNTGPYVKTYCRAHYQRYRKYGDKLAPDGAVTSGTQCSVPECKSDVMWRMLCGYHYYRNRNYGDPIDAPTRGRQVDTLEERLEQKTPKDIPDEDCWEWLGSTDADGYGFVYYQRKRIKAHRLAFSTHNGPIPAGNLVRHTCDNPPCVNPSHLLVGVSLDNVHDMISRGRKGSPSKLSDADRSAIRELRSNGLPVKDIASLYSISGSTVSRITNTDI